MKENIRTAVIVVALWAATNWAWDKWGRAWFAGDSTASGGAGGAGGSGGAGGAGGSGSGDSGAGGGGSYSGPDYAALADAIQALANGTRLPNIQTVVITGASGDNTILAGEGGKVTRVMAYAVSGAGTVTAKFRSGNQARNLWELDLSAPAGNSGGNLATAWPSFLFHAEPGEDLKINLDSAAAVAVTYWREDA